MERNITSVQVSVIVTTRDRLRFLKQCVDSVFCQRGVTWELIIVDDASTDPTRTWLASMAGMAVRTHYFNDRGERCKARNQGLSMAQGRFIMFLDDDDWLWPNALESLAAALNEHPGAVAATGARWDVFSDEDYERRDAHPRSLLERNIQDELLFGWSAVSGQNLYRTSIIRSIGGYTDDSLVPCEDRDLWLKVATRGSVVIVPQRVMSYRYHAGQIRPLGIYHLRDRVIRKAIRALPKERRRRALLLRQSGRMIEQAETEMSQGNPFIACWIACAAVSNSPGIFTSTLIGEWVFRRLAGRFYRRFFPPSARKKH